MEFDVTIYPLKEVCDFCSSADVVVGFLIEDFTLPEYGWGSKGGFAACEICKVLVETRQQAALEQRAFNTFVNRFGDVIPHAITRRFIRRLHSEFWKRYGRVNASVN